VRFLSPSAGARELAPPAGRPGLQHVAFTVDDVRGVVDRVRRDAALRALRRRNLIALLDALPR